MRQKELMQREKENVLANERRSVGKQLHMTSFPWAQKFMNECKIIKLRLLACFIAIIIYTFYRLKGIKMNNTVGLSCNLNK